MNNVSFGSMVRIPANIRVNRATSYDLVDAINGAFSGASKELGRAVYPIREVSATSVEKLNPGSFNRATHLITPKGITGFNAVNKQFKVTSNSTVVDFGKKIQKYIIETFRLNGSVDRYFDYFTK